MIACWPALGVGGCKSVRKKWLMCTSTLYYGHGHDDRSETDAKGIAYGESP